MIFERRDVGTSEMSSFWCNGPSIIGTQILLGHQKQIILALFLKNLAILRNATLLQGLN